DTIAAAADIVLDNGYYLSNNDDSYIHIEDGRIELCGYDYAAAFTDSWNELGENKVSLEEYIENSAEILLDQIKLQEYTPVRLAGLGEDGTDVILLALNYEFASSVGAYTGYTLNSDGTISKVDNIYSYYGAELPQDSSDNIQTIDTISTEEGETLQSDIVNTSEE
ncbi:MAG: hypothetical protein K2O14_06895, partial [Oscillospiraceae bacterium]|nr:hypothetical protein [Oscillospiraceae bacterium]